MVGMEREEERERERLGAMMIAGLAGRR
jgi:hypothetical protein